MQRGSVQGNFKPKETVFLHGLTSEKGRELNGLPAELLNWQSDTKRWRVRIMDKEEKGRDREHNIQSKNLRRALSYASPCSYPDCKTGQAATKVCSQCKHAVYCCVSCQTRDWSRHKKKCKEISSRLKNAERAVELAAPGEARESAKRFRDVLKRSARASLSAAKAEAGLQEGSDESVVVEKLNNDLKKQLKLAVNAAARLQESLNSERDRLLKMTRAGLSPYASDAIKAKMMRDMSDSLDLPIFKPTGIDYTGIRNKLLDVGKIGGFSALVLQHLTIYYGVLTDLAQLYQQQGYTLYRMGRTAGAKSRWALALDVGIQAWKGLSKTIRPLLSREGSRDNRINVAKQAVEHVLAFVMTPASMAVHKQGLGPEYIEVAVQDALLRMTTLELNQMLDIIHVIPAGVMSSRTKTLLDLVTEHIRDNRGGQRR